jgi:hypothetical protein
MPGLATIWISRGKAWPAELPPPDRVCGVVEAAAETLLGGVQPGRRRAEALGFFALARRKSAGDTSRERISGDGTERDDGGTGRFR